MAFTTSKSLLSRIHHGNEIAWSDFFTTYRPLVFMRGRDFHLTDYECDELLSRVMMKFFNAQKTFIYTPEQGRFRDYFRRLIRNCAYDILRERKKEERVEALDPEKNDPPAPANDRWDDEWRAHLCRQAMLDVRGRLSERAVQAFEACRMKGEKPADVAKFLNVSIATVYTDCALVLKELQRTVRKFSREY